MYYTDRKLQYPVRCEKPNPLFAKMLQQAIGGVEGEMRVCLQYFFQAWGNRGPSSKYRDMLLQTATEEIAHIEMLATAVALNLEKAPVTMQEEAAQNPAVEAVLGGMNPRHILSAGLAALPVNSNGVPFDSSNIYASGNLAADMYANVAAEATGRTLVARLYHMTDDPGMRDFLAFQMARDTMHQQQWLAVIEELGPQHLPIPNSWPQEKEPSQFSYAFISPYVGEAEAVQAEQAEQRWAKGPSIDGHGEFHFLKAEGYGQVPNLGPARPDTYGEMAQVGAIANGVHTVKEKVTSFFDGSK